VAIAKIDHIYLPKVYVEETQRRIIGDRSSSAMGTTHMDIAAVKRTWKLDLRPLPKSDVFDLISHLDAKLWGVVEFWIDYFGAESNVVLAYVSIPGDVRSLSQPGRRALSIVVDEK